MKICLYGVGAVGGLIGARLAVAGHALNAVARGATLAALRRDGLGLETAEGRRQFPIHAVAEPAELGEQDLVIVAVKQPALASVAAAIGPLVGPHTRVLVAMNGVPWWFFDGLTGPLAGISLQSVDPADDLRSLIPTAQVIGCVVHIACNTPAPGVCRLGFGNGLILGDALGGPPSVFTQTVAELLAGAGLDARLSDGIQRDIWYKLWGNMTMNPVSALTGATSDRILDDALVNAFVVAVMEEAATVGERIGCPVAQTPQARNAVTRELGEMRTSMLQDVEAGRALEIDALLGVVVEIAGKVGVPVPHTSALLGLVRLFGRVRGLY